MYIFLKLHTNLRNDQYEYRYPKKIGTKSVGIVSNLKKKSGIAHRFSVIQVIVLV